MKRMYNIPAVLLFLAVSVMAREITVVMWDYYRGSWDGAALGISVNGVVSNASKEDGLDRDFFYFNAGVGDNVVFYWHKGNNSGMDDGECAFAVYYNDEPPSPPFNPENSAHDADALLLYKLYGSLASASEGEELGSFTVVPPKPFVTVSPQSVSLSVGGARQFTADVKNLDDRSVTWSVGGAANSGTVIGADGVLTVSPQETAAALTVTAACNANPEIYATAAVRVYLPYRVGTAAELKAFADSVNAAGGTGFRDRLVLLTGDIDLSAYGAQFNGGKGWAPIGTGSRFRGVFDGGGHVIRNLYINDTTGDYTGLFGNIDTGLVQNLGLVNVNVRGRLRAGGLAGSVNAGNGDAVANCYVTGSVSGSQYVGGIAGQVNGGGLTNCYAAGSVSGSQYAGGITGQIGEQGSVGRCYSAAEVSGSNFIGGIAGSAAGAISNCAALNPDVTGNNSAGRVAGSAGAAAALSGNAAFANLLNRAGNRNWNNKGPAAIDGEDISPGVIRADGTLGGRFADSPWAAAAGKLPGLLGGPVDMPGHITEFYVLRYVIPPAYGTPANADTSQTIKAGADGRAVIFTERLGYTFYQWSDGSTDNPRQDKNVLSDMTVTAYFMDDDGNVSIKTLDRIIPITPPKEESTVTAPVTILAGEFTAGPNPISKQYGIVNFYRQGRRVANSELRIYDVTGNAINMIKISDNVIGTQSKRIVGCWDLTDKKGRKVSDGAYLVKGVLRASDGKSEKVSLIMVVR